MAIDWSKTSDADQDFHTSMMNYPFGDPKEKYCKEFGQPTLEEHVDVHGLALNIFVWEHQRRDGSPAFALAMYVEDEIFDDSILAEGNSPDDVFQRCLDVFCVGSPIVMSIITGQKVKTTLNPSAQGLHMWVADRKHLFEMKDGIMTVRQEFLKKE